MLQDLQSAFWHYNDCIALIVRLLSLLGCVALCCLSSGCISRCPATWKSCNTGCHMKIKSNERCSGQESNLEFLALGDRTSHLCKLSSSTLLFVWAWTLNGCPCLHGCKVEVVQSPMLDLFRSKRTLHVWNSRQKSCHQWTDWTGHPMQCALSSPTEEYQPADLVFISCQNLREFGLLTFLCVWTWCLSPK